MFKCLITIKKFKDAFFIKYKHKNLSRVSVKFKTFFSFSQSKLFTLVFIFSFKKKTIIYKVPLGVILNYFYTEDMR
jgi:hypothetical protein